VLLKLIHCTCTIKRLVICPVWLTQCSLDQSGRFLPSPAYWTGTTHSPIA